ncbi:Hypothetical protein A7982_04574 [Minicystis rosea]|nr:Hypothetical protein A7982_04574 [Minicystis rosea]
MTHVRFTRPTRFLSCLAAGALAALASSGACTPRDVSVGSNALGSAGADGDALASYPVATNDPSCPDHWTLDLQAGGACTTNGTVCAYQWEGGGWLACSCGCRESNVWFCSGSGSSLGCVSERPIEGSSCAGHENQGCTFFPRTQCTCGAGTTWSCNELATPEWKCIDPPSDFSADTSGVSPTTVLSALSDADASAWCAWYTGVSSAPALGEVFFCLESQACFPGMSTAQCVASLKAQACNATVQELDDCVQTRMNGCYRVGQGCSAFLSHASCHGTIVDQTDGAGGSGNCHLQL